MKNINIKTIRIDGGTQSRVEINNEIVTEYAEAIKGGAEFPPVVIFNDGVDNWLADGFHRFHAHNQAKKSSISVDVRQGTARDAILFSLGANGSHGLRRSNADKRKAVMTLVQDFDWSEMSSNAMAKTCGVSHTFVDSVKSSLATVASDKPKEVTFKTKHGTVATMQTANIGKKPAKPWEQPDTAYKEALEEIGITEEELHGNETTEEFYDRLEKENKELCERIEVLTADDLQKKLNDQVSEIYGLRGCIQQLMGSEKSMYDKLKYHADLFHKLAKIYGVNTHKEILAAAQAQVA
jgi:hypothetical protein